MKKLTTLLFSVILIFFSFSVKQSNASTCHIPPNGRAVICNSCEDFGYITKTIIYSGHPQRDMFFNFSILDVDPNPIVCVTANCRSSGNDYDVSQSTNCYYCDDGYYLSESEQRCIVCPFNATCDKTSFTCNPGYYLTYYKQCDPCPNHGTCPGNNRFTCDDGWWASYAGDYYDCYPCDKTCKTCSGGGASACLTCPSGRYLSGGKCLDCPANATCSGGTSSFSCNSGYREENGSCVSDRTVSSCPARMTESADGKCCLNK